MRYEQSPPVKNTILFTTISEPIFQKAIETKIPALLRFGINFLKDKGFLGILELPFVKGILTVLTFFLTFLNWVPPFQRKLPGLF